MSHFYPLDIQLQKDHTSQVLSHFLQFNGSFQSMENMASIVNSTPNASIKVPSSKYLIKKAIPPAITSEIHIECSNCQNYIASASSNTSCDECNRNINTSSSDYFVHLPIKQQLILSIERNFDEISFYSSTVTQSDQMCDIHNAQIFKSAQEYFPNSILLPLIINTDGVKVFNSNQKSLWMIQAAQAYLPPNKRYLPQNILIIAAHFGSKKIKMPMFFFPLLKELRDIVDMGGIMIERNGKKFNFTPFILCCSCDLPAKADLQEMVGHSGRYGCSYCLHPGVTVKPDKNRKAVLRFINDNKNYQLRTHDSVISTYDRLGSLPINGIKNICCLVSAHKFDLIDGFAIDVMHCVHLGVVKKFLSLWLDASNKSMPYYIKKKNQIILSSRIINIKPIAEILRKPKSIFQKGEYKANEFRSLLLYYLPFALPGLLDNQYVQHFRLLSYAIYTLSKKEILFSEIEMASHQLNEFVEKYERIYGKSNVTMNVHL